MYLLLNLQSLSIGHICKALNFMKLCTKTNFFTGIFKGRFLHCKYFLKLLHLWKNFGCFGVCNITKIRIHYRHLKIKQGNVIFCDCIFDVFNSLGPSDIIQATNNLFGGCISVWKKEDKEWYRHVFFGQYVVLFQKKMLHIFCITKGIWIRNMTEADIQKCALK